MRNYVEFEDVTKNYVEKSQEFVFECGMKKKDKCEVPQI